jgi:RES domain-containing protein
VVYASETLALAALEYLVHVDPAIAPDGLVSIAAEIPDSVAIREVDLSDLPADWRGYPALEALAQIGTAWANTGSSAVLRVPSAIVPTERNYLLNPAHPEFRRIKIGVPRPFAFDPRLLKR